MLLHRIQARGYTASQLAYLFADAHGHAWAGDLFHHAGDDQERALELVRDGLDVAVDAYWQAAAERRESEVFDGLPPSESHLTLTGRTYWSCESTPDGGGVAVIEIRRPWKSLGVLSFAERSGAVVITAAVDDDGEVAVFIPEPKLVHIGHVEALNACIGKLGVRLIFFSPEEPSYLLINGEDDRDDIRSDVVNAAAVQTLTLPGDEYLCVMAPMGPGESLVILSGGDEEVDA